MGILVTALAAGLASGALWYLALAVALHVTAWIALALAALGALLTFFAIARDAGRL